MWKVLVRGMCGAWFVFASGRRGNGSIVAAKSAYEEAVAYGFEVCLISPTKKLVLCSHRENYVELQQNLMDEVWEYGLLQPLNLDHGEVYYTPRWAMEAGRTLVGAF